MVRKQSASRTTAPRENRNIRRVTVAQRATTVGQVEVKNGRNLLDVKLGNPAGKGGNYPV